jgi:hypothetical protein
MVTGVSLMSLPACTKSIIASCTAPPPPTALVVVYPINGATSVPDSPQSIVFAQYTTCHVTLAGLQLVLTPASGPPILASPGPAPSPLPTPNTPPPAGTTLVGFVVPTLAAATTYQASFNGTETVQGSMCGPFGIQGGSRFTTQ